MEEEKPDTDDFEIYWFWEVTTKWWGIAAFYLILSFFAYLITFEEYGVNWDIIFAPIFMPIGLYILVSSIIAKFTFWDFDVNIALLSSLLFFILFVVGYARILINKNKNNKIMKKLIILLIILILLSFMGCVAGNAEFITELITAQL